MTASPLLTLDERIVAAVVEHAREAAPDECCGLLIGGPLRVTAAVRARNIAERPSTTFLIDPRDHLDAMRDARRRTLDVVGFYHSHPRSAAEPSERDRAGATYPDYLYLIVGLAAHPPDVRLYRLVEGNFRPEAFVTVP